MKENILKQTSASEKKYYADRFTKKSVSRSTVIKEEDEDSGAAASEAKKSEAA